MTGHATDCGKGLASAAVTNIGICRSANQDAYVSLPDEGVFCVADGIGGGWKGERASGTVVQTIHEVFRNGRAPGLDWAERIRRVSEALTDAGQLIRADTLRHGESSSGTTAVALVMDPCTLERACVLNVGDSRLYRYRGGTLERLTRDHTLLAEAGVRDPRHASLLPFRNVLTRAVGIAEEVAIDEAVLQVEDGDQFLLCSDGLTAMVSDDDMAAALREGQDQHPHMVVDRLVDKALWSGGLDNITAILVTVDHAATLPARIRRWWRRRRRGGHHGEGVAVGGGDGAA